MAIPNVKFRRDTVAMTRALSARQNDLSMVPSCSGELLLEIHKTKNKMVILEIIRDSTNFR